MVDEVFLQKWVDSAQYCFSQAEAWFKREDSWPWSKPSLSPSSSFSLFHAISLYCLYECFQRQSPWWWCGTPLLPPRSSLEYLIDGWGMAIKTICSRQILPDKHYPHLLTSRECLFTRDIFLHTSMNSKVLELYFLQSWNTKQNKFPLVFIHLFSSCCAFIV